MIYRVNYFSNEANVWEYVFNNSWYFSVCSFKSMHKSQLSKSYSEFFEFMAPFSMETPIVSFHRYQHYRKGQKFHYFKLEKEAKDFLMKNSFNSWNLPELPEDLAFYNSKGVWLYSISHENLIYLCVQDPSVVQALIDLGCKIDMLSE